jgi:rod shape-determining protein MreC
MAIPDIRQRAGYLFLAVAVGHIILISAQVNTSHGVPLLQAFVFWIFSGVQRGTASVVGSARSGWDGYVALQHVHEDNQALKRRLRDLEVTLQRERALAAESEGLRKLLDLRNRTDLPTRSAEVIGTSGTADSRALTINLGTSDGIAEDMAVVAPAGAVGCVLAGATAHAANVLLLVDRSAAAAVMVERTRAQGIVLGTGQNLLRLEYVSSSAIIEKGDRLVTSGIDGVYPQGFLVGVIVELEKSGGTYRSIQVRPAVDFSALEQVLVVVGARPVGPRPPLPGESEGARQRGAQSPGRVESPERREPGAGSPAERQP